MDGTVVRSGDQPSSGDGASSDTRERLLDAAEDLFAGRGYAATSVRSIVAAAGCNLAAVNYHFGSKRQLYQEVFRRRLGALREQRLSAVQTAAATAGENGDLEGTLLAFARAFLAPLHDDPRGRQPLRLMLREVVDPLLPPGFFHRELILPVSRALAATVARAAPELSEREIRLCVQSFLGQLLHVMHTQRIEVTGLAGDDDPLSTAELVDHVVRFTVAGVNRLQHQGCR